MRDSASRRYATNCPSPFGVSLLASNLNTPNMKWGVFYFGLCLYGMYWFTFVQMLLRKFVILVIFKHHSLRMSPGGARPTRVACTVLLHPIVPLNLPFYFPLLLFYASAER